MSAESLANAAQGCSEAGKYMPPEGVVVTVLERVAFAGTVSYQDGPLSLNRAAATRGGLVRDHDGRAGEQDDDDWNEEDNDEGAACGACGNWIDEGDTVNEVGPTTLCEPCYTNGRDWQQDEDDEDWDDEDNE